MIDSPKNAAPRTAGVPPPEAAVWIISDGKAGHEAQCKGVAEALNAAYEMKHIAPRGLGRLLAPWGPASGLRTALAPGGLLAGPLPRLILATGRQTIPYLRALRRRAGPRTFTVVLMDPRTGRDTADLIWVPEHDRLRGPRVITTVTMPNVYSAAQLASLRREPLPAEIAALPPPRIAVLIGGPNGDYRFDDADIARLITQLRMLATSGAGLMITASRRTPDAVQTAIGDLATLSNVFVWGGSGTNPYPQFLARADHIVVTADSVAMVSEAAATGRPVHVFTPSGRSAKFDRFHGAMAKLGVTRPLVATGDGLATWQYAPVHAADSIAATIHGAMAARDRATARFAPGSRTTGR